MCTLGDFRRCGHPVSTVMKGGLQMIYCTRAYGFQFRLTPEKDNIDSGNFFRNDTVIKLNFSLISKFRRLDKKFCINILIFKKYTMF